MIFVPFTGVDNHKNSITLAAALISKEDADSYTWILKAFLSCMASAPQIVLTDQDPALKKIIPQLFPDTHHRYCIWHIMKKLSLKIGFAKPGMEEFTNRLKTIVYDYLIEPPQFESQWNTLLVEFGEVDNSWLQYQFALRYYWVPCFFRDIPLGGLLRTTSRSESENSFFNGFLSQHKNLVGFFSGFESALDAQRYKQSLDDHNCLLKSPPLETPLQIEKYAAQVFTLAVFRDIQTELLASSFEISVASIQENQGVTLFQFNDSRYSHITFQVNSDPASQIWSCTCKAFERIGQPCRHMFYAFRTCGLSTIPDAYVLQRWKKEAVVYPQTDLSNTIIQPPSRLLKDPWLQFRTCMNLVGDDDVKKQYISSTLDEIKAHLENPAATNTTIAKDHALAHIVGSAQSDSINIHPPAAVYTKGSGKRLIGLDEQILQKATKPLRLCRTCNKKCNHDSRTCPER